MIANKRNLPRGQGSPPSFSDNEVKMCDSEVAAAVARSPSRASSLISGNITGLDHSSQVLMTNLEDMAKENYWLREKLKEMTSDRDRLLCEVANLRLELDMNELKRLPDDNKYVSHTFLNGYYLSPSL